MQALTSNDLKILQYEGMISIIGRKIPSPRSRTGHISRQHVRNVLTGKITTESPVNNEIWNRANDFLRIYKQLNLKQ
jgi:hypothetical protein